MNNINYIFNILITGLDNVGKTSLIEKYTNKQYNNYSNNLDNLNYYLSNNKSYDHILWLDNYCIKLNIIDHYSNNDISTNFFIADAIIILCDITNENSYNIDEILNYKKLYCNNTINHYIVNNKVDLINLFFDKKDYTNKYFNISVKINYGINNLFKMIIRNLIDNIYKKNHNKLLVDNNNSFINNIDFNNIEYIIDHNNNNKNFFNKLYHFFCT
jgi:GTPase SAR1 family protein